MQNNSISKNQNAVNQCKNENDVLKSIRWYMTKKEDEIFGILSQFDKEYIKENRDLLKKATQGEFLSDEEKIQLEEFIEASLSYTEMKDYIKEQVQEVEWKSTGINSSGNEWFKEFWTDQEGELTTDNVEKVDIYGYDTFMEFVKKYDILQYMDMEYEDFVNLKSLELVELGDLCYEDLNKLKILEFIEELNITECSYFERKLPEPLKKNLKIKKIRLDFMSYITTEELNKIEGLEYAESVELVGDWLKHIPEKLKKNTNLKYINISYARDLPISELDEIIGLQSVKRARFLSTNSMISLPKNLNKNFKLELLEVGSEEEISEEQIIIFKKELKEFQKEHPNCIIK